MGKHSKDYWTGIFKFVCIAAALGPNVGLTPHVRICDYHRQRIAAYFEHFPAPDLVRCNIPGQLRGAKWERVL